VHMSTNKVYGDAPNLIPLVELATRWDYADRPTPTASRRRLPSTSRSTRSRRVEGRRRRHGAGVWPLFRPATCCLRGGCLTGPNHSGVELHGFLSYLVKCNLEAASTGYSFTRASRCATTSSALDVARFMAAFVAAPRAGEVYNLGGGKANSCSILEAFQLAERHTGRAQRTPTSTSRAAAIISAITPTCADARPLSGVGYFREPDETIRRSRAGNDDRPLLRVTLLSPRLELRRISEGMMRNTHQWALADF